MAHVDDGRGGKSVNVDLNIVPFIDLMSVCISFLIISAVWTQVSMIQLGNSIYAKKQQDQDPTPPPPRADVPFRLDIKPTGFFVIAGRERSAIPPQASGELDVQGLLKVLASVKQSYPDKVDCVVTVADEMPYESMIIGMDALLKSGFPAISVTTQEAI